MVNSDASQRRYLADSFRQFWDSLDRVFEIAANGKPGRSPHSDSQFAPGAAGGAE